jgi:hypothetical protein
MKRQSWAEWVGIVVALVLGITSLGWQIWQYRQDRAEKRVEQAEKQRQQAEAQRERPEVQYGRVVVTSDGRRILICRVGNAGPRDFAIELAWLSTQVSGEVKLHEMKFYQGEATTVRAGQTSDYVLDLAPLREEGLIDSCAVVVLTANQSLTVARLPDTFAKDVYRLPEGAHFMPLNHIESLSPEQTRQTWVKRPRASETTGSPPETPSTDLTGSASK